VSLYQLLSAEPGFPARGGERAATDWPWGGRATIREVIGAEPTIPRSRIVSSDRAFRRRPLNADQFEYAAIVVAARDESWFATATNVPLPYATEPQSALEGSDLLSHVFPSAE
jgi:hypothetical protein